MIFIFFFNPYEFTTKNEQCLTSEYHFLFQVCCLQMEFSTTDRHHMDDRRMTDRLQTEKWQSKVALDKNPSNPEEDNSPLFNCML